MSEQIPLMVKAGRGGGGNIYAVTEYEVMEDGTVLAEERHDVTSQLEAMVDRGALGDGYHTMPELYAWRATLHALAVNALTQLRSDAMTVKSWRHSDGQPPFGAPHGEWFVVVTTFPEGEQASNHYRKEYWATFDVPEVDRAPTFDGHTAARALEIWQHWLAYTARGALGD